MIKLKYHINFKMIKIKEVKCLLTIINLCLIDSVKICDLVLLYEKKIKIRGKNMIVQVPPLIKLPT